MSAPVPAPAAPAGRTAAPVDLLFVVAAAAEGELLVRLLQRTGCTARMRVARGGREALARLHPPAGVEAPPPRAVFLDVHLPAPDGWALLERLRADPRTATLPLVVLSGPLEPADVARAYRLGANGVLEKPADPFALAGALARAAGYWLDANVAPPPPALPSTAHRRIPTFPEEPQP